jgi:hypothetical protein
LYAKHFAFVRDEAPYDNAQAKLAYLGFGMLIPLGGALGLRLAWSRGPGLIGAAALVSEGVLMMSGQLVHIGAWGAATDISKAQGVDFLALNTIFGATLEVAGWVMTGGWLAAGRGALGAEPGDPESARRWYLVGVVSPRRRRLRLSSA